MYNYYVAMLHILFYRQDFRTGGGEAMPTCDCSISTQGVYIENHRVINSQDEIINLMMDFF